MQLLIEPSRVFCVVLRSTSNPFILLSIRNLDEVCVFLLDNRRHDINVEMIELQAYRTSLRSHRTLIVAIPNRIRKAFKNRCGRWIRKNEVR